MHFLLDMTFRYFSGYLFCFRRVLNRWPGDWTKIGKVRVVDRQNIAKIVKGYEFQASDLTDESTAVEIGKLAGADIIVIGSINFVGKKYYLNVKLIAVETAEIIGSSISDADDSSEFYEMSNDAVYKLF